ncbi:MAG: S-methyl-5-thioribose-1-phosphate isomerase [Omnitrophica bacterium GWA2_52_8]|nr:MAG: S-methyl-5-thioribose-1-phosphate isomerase [Omnitrophica bacterium GWA2_52_8]
MNVNGKPCRSIWKKPGDDKVIQIIDQRDLPFRFTVADLKTDGDAERAIREMWIRGAPLIGVTAAYGVYLGLLRVRHSRSMDADMEVICRTLGQTRPTAVNLQWSLQVQRDAVLRAGLNADKIAAALATADKIADEDAAMCEKIGNHGVALIEALSRQKNGAPVRILTHCNAGWLACVDWGTKTAPIYKAHRKGIALHVYVDETRPRNQGSKLTAWELGQEKIPHDVIVDNAGGHLMQRGMIDLVLVGADRVTRRGDVANKIGTYLKALAAYDNKIPFYAAFPSSSIDWNMNDGVIEIPIEERDSEEVTHMTGESGGKIFSVRVSPAGASALNYGFDVTPARLVTGFITERGICPASGTGLISLFPERQTGAHG